MNKSLEAEIERNPAGSHRALFVAVKGLSSETEWKEEENNNHSFEVLGGTHLSLAIKDFMNSMGRTHTLRAECLEFIWGLNLMNKLFT